VLAKIQPCALAMGWPATTLPLATLARVLYLPTMSVATLQQLGQDLPAWVALVRSGETVAITEGGHVVAKLSPANDDTDTSTPKSTPARWPDFAARRRAIFGDTVLPAGTVQELIDEDRGE
jgi:antitoxin (DNA-binding transcriptional repressor) of toxin-antitoxin stability system